MRKTNNPLSLVRSQFTVGRTTFIELAVSVQVQHIFNTYHGLRKYLDDALPRKSQLKTY